MQPAVELVDQAVDGSVHILALGLGEQRLATQVDGCLGVLRMLLGAENDVRVDHLFERFDQFLHLAPRIGLERIGDFQLMAGNGEVHLGTPLQMNGAEGDAVDACNRAAAGAGPDPLASPRRRGGSGGAHTFVR